MSRESAIEQINSKISTAKMMRDKYANDCMEIYDPENLKGFEEKHHDYARWNSELNSFEEARRIIAEHIAPDIKAKS